MPSTYRAIRRNLLFPLSLSLGACELVTGLGERPDEVAPTLTLTSPAEDVVQKTGEVTVSGTVTDDVGVERVTLSLNGGSEQPIQVTPGKSVTFTATVSNLAEGSNVVRIRAADKAGNFAEVIRTVGIDATAPSFSLVPPASPVLETSVVVQGTARDNRRITKLTVQLGTAPPQNVTFTPDSVVSFQARVTGLTAGDNTIAIVVEDVVGNLTRTTTTVRYDPILSVCSAPSGYKRWVGITSTDWTVASNWFPTGAPAASENVYLCPTASLDPALSGNASVGFLSIPSGATLALGGTLTSSAAVDATGGITGSGTLRMTGDNFALGGSVPNVTVTGNIASTQTLRVAGNLRVDGGLFRLHVTPVFVSGDVITESRGRLFMGMADAQLQVTGDVRLRGTAQPADHTAGLISLRGSFYATPESFLPAAAHTVQFAGTSPSAEQRVENLFGTGSFLTFGNLQVAASGRVTFYSGVSVKGTLLVQTGTLINPTGSSFAGIVTAERLHFASPLARIFNNGIIVYCDFYRNEGATITGNAPIQAQPSAPCRND